MNRSKRRRRGVDALSLQRAVDGAHDPVRIRDAAEREVELGAAGGVEVDRADPQQPLEHRLARVDVLHALQPRLVHVAAEQAEVDRQPAVGDRVGRPDPPDETDQHDRDHPHDHGEHDPRDLDVLVGESLDQPGERADRDRATKPLRWKASIERHDGWPWKKISSPGSGSIRAAYRRLTLAGRPGTNACAASTLGSEPMTERIRSPVRHAAAQSLPT